MLALVGVAAAALGTGFLANQDEIMINLQGLGVGVELVSLPLSDVWIDLSVEKLTEITFVSTTGGGFFNEDSAKTIFVNRVNKCSFHYSEEDSQLPPAPDNNLGPGSVVICKLSDEDGDIVAEGRIIANQGPIPDAASPCTSEEWDLRDANGDFIMCVDYIPPSQTWQIPIMTWACADELCTRVGWVNDVEIVVLGNFSGVFNAP